MDGVVDGQDFGFPGWKIEIKGYIIKRSSVLRENTVMPVRDYNVGDVFLFCQVYYKFIQGVKIISDNRIYTSLGQGLGKDKPFVMDMAKIVMVPAKMVC